MSQDNIQVEKHLNCIPRLGGGWIIIGIIHLVWSLLVMMPCHQAKAAEATQETAAQARQLQMDATLLQIHGDIEGAIKKYEESLALQANEKLTNLVNQLKKHSKVNQGPKEVPVTVEREARPTTSAQSPPPSEREEPPATAGTLPRQHLVTDEREVGIQIDPMILDRTLAEKLIKESGMDLVIVRVGGTNCISISDFLEKNKYGREKVHEKVQHSWEPEYFFDDKFLQFFTGFSKRDITREGACVFPDRDLNIVYGRILKVKCTGISNIDKNKKRVELELFIDRSPVGEKIGPESIAIVTQYNLYDDGWRFDSILFEDVKDEWAKKYFYGLAGFGRVANDMLLNMYKIKQYSSNYNDFLKILERSNIPEFISTVALVYKDKGQKEKAIELYDNKIFPILKKKGGDLYKYEKLFDEIKK